MATSTSRKRRMKEEFEEEVELECGRMMEVDPNAKDPLEVTITMTINKQAITMGEEEEEERKMEESRPGLTMAGPTNPLQPKRVQVIQPIKFSEEPLHLECEWKDCNFRSNLMEEFMDHVGSHVPLVEVVLTDNYKPTTVILSCTWKYCPWKTDQGEDFKRHLYLHAYHTKLKCIGYNTKQRTNLNPCNADSKNRNILPNLTSDLICAWDDCCQIFANIQLYYDHIKYHIDATPRGKNVPGGIPCGWRGCASVFPNAVKLKDHMKSHTQEKLLACPTCGGLFANRTRFFDHCRRQVLLEEEMFACDVCMKHFSTARLLRDHIRSHINTYKCHLCDMSCSSPSSLNQHMRYKHTEDKPYACQSCSYSCKAYNDLVRHTKVHTECTLKCEEEGCTFQCKAITSLKAHWARVHGDGENKYACHLCEKKFFKGNYLTKHLISVHNIQWPTGHSRLRYKVHDDGYYRLLTVRYESIEEPQQD